jgi:hypothetical protein
MYRRAHALALQRMLEEHTYFGVVYGMWRKDEISAEYGPNLFRTIPSIANSWIFSAMIPLIRLSSKSKLLRDLDGQVRQFCDMNINHTALLLLLVSIKPI